MAKKIPEDSVQFYQIIGLWEYPWHEWLDGSVWELTLGEDFHTPSVPKFRDQVKYVAGRQGKAIRTRIRGNRLYIQAYEDPG